MAGFWKNASGFLESNGKVLEIFVTKKVGTLIQPLNNLCHLSGKAVFLNE